MNKTKKNVKKSENYENNKRKDKIIGRIIKIYIK